MDKLMRTLKGVTALACVAAIVAACSSGGATPSPAASTAPSVAPSAASAAPTDAPSPTADACAPDTLALKTAGKLKSAGAAFSTPTTSRI